jgi:hypothetical protein
MILVRSVAAASQSNAETGDMYRASNRSVAPDTLAYGNHDLPSHVPRFQMAHGLGGFAQRVGLVGDQCDTRR